MSVQNLRNTDQPLWHGFSALAIWADLDLYVAEAEPTNIHYYFPYKHTYIYMYVLYLSYSENDWAEYQARVGMSARHKPWLLTLWPQSTMKCNSCESHPIFSGISRQTRDGSSPTAPRIIHIYVCVKWSVVFPAQTPCVHWIKNPLKLARRGRVRWTRRAQADRVMVRHLMLPYVEHLFGTIRL